MPNLIANVMQMRPPKPGMCLLMHTLYKLYTCRS